MSSPQLFRRVRHIHMTGIGGAGMSGIAEVLLNLGFIVSGSDLQLSEVTDRLTQLGAAVTEGHDAANVQSCDVVVYSSAVRPENVEIRAARERHIPTIPRSEMLAELMRLKVGIAVSGTHGKTTTTSMIGAVLQKADLNPTLIVGGIVRALQSGAKMGSGDLLVVEADEFDRSFLKLTPTLAVITTIEPEHLDTYTDLAGVQDAFVEFANRVPFHGTVVACGDEPNIRFILPRIKRPIVSYGFNEDCQFRAFRTQQQKTRIHFHATHSGISLGDFALQVPGRYNILNALAAIAIACEMDIPIEVTRAALTEFSGVHRRFEIKGECNGAIIVDDYAHHPTEVENTLKTASECWPDRRIIALFQPHLFTRTRDFASDFGRALGNADLVLLADIYPSRERPIEGVTSLLIAESARSQGSQNIEMVGNSNIAERARSLLQANDVLVVMGAGNITRVSDDLTREARENRRS